MEKTKPDSPLSDSRQSERDTGEDLEEIDIHEEMQKTQQLDNPSENGINDNSDKDAGKDTTYDHISPESKRSPVQHRTSDSVSMLHSSSTHYTSILLVVICFCFHIERTAVSLATTMRISS